MLAYDISMDLAHTRAIVCWGCHNTSSIWNKNRHNVSRLMYELQICQGAAHNDACLMGAVFDQLVRAIDATRKAAQRVAMSVRRNEASRLGDATAAELPRKSNAVRHYQEAMSNEQ